MTTVQDADVDESAAAATCSPEPGPADARTRQLRLAISLRSLATAAVAVTFVGVLGALAWLYAGARHELDVQARQSQANARAEKVALDYAVNAAEINFHDLNAWKSKLIAGTGPDLSEKLTKAGREMEQILVPLEWASTARSLVAKVRSEAGGVYVVDCFVSVLTKTVQAPEPLQSTATYSVTVDSNNNWQINDVGGIGSVVEQK